MASSIATRSTLLHAPHTPRRPVISADVKERSKSRCMSTLRELIPLFTYNFWSRTIVWPPFFVNSNTAQAKTLQPPRTPTETLTKSTHELFKTLSSHASDNEIVHVSGYQSVRGSETFRRKTPDCWIRSGSPSTHGRQELDNRETPTLWCIPMSVHGFESFTADRRGKFIAHLISSRALACTYFVSCIFFPSPCKNADLACAHSNSA